MFHRGRTTEIEQIKLPLLNRDGSQTRSPKLSKQDSTASSLLSRMQSIESSKLLSSPKKGGDSGYMRGNTLLDSLAANNHKATMFLETDSDKREDLQDEADASDEIEDGLNIFELKRRFAKDIELSHQRASEHNSECQHFKHITKSVLFPLCSNPAQIKIDHAEMPELVLRYKEDRGKKTGSWYELCREEDAEQAIEYIFARVREAVQAMSSDDQQPKEPKDYIKCLNGHDVFEDSGYFCHDCQTKYFPADHWNYYQGYDILRDTCILDNYKQHFIFRDKDGQLHERHEALKRIIKSSYKKNLDKTQTVQQPFEDKLRLFSIRGFMLQEGNNCQFLSTYISNVIVRFDTDISPISFETTWSKDVKMLEETNDEYFSEIIVQDSSPAENSDKAIRIRLSQKSLLRKLEELKQQGALGVTAQLHPTLVFKKIFKRSDNHFNNFTFGFHNNSICDYKVRYQEQIVTTNINAIQIRPSSNIFELEDRFCQLYQTCIESDLGGQTDQSIFTLHEYQVSWGKSGQPLKNAIALSGMKVFMPRDSMKNRKFYPNADAHFTINGTKMGFQLGDKCLQLLFPRPEVFNFETECVLANYQRVLTKASSRTACLVVEAQLTSELVNLLTNEEKALVLQNAIKVIWNMVPDDGSTDIREISNKIWQSSNLLQPMEILGCHCVAEFILNNQKAIELLQQTVDERTQSTLFDQLISGKAQSGVIRSQLNKYSNLLARPSNVMSDLCMRNVIQACINYEKPKAMSMVANMLLHHIFDQKTHDTCQYNLLVGLFDQIINLEIPLDGYSRFFKSGKSENCMCNFAQRLKTTNFAYQTIPSNGSTELELKFLTKEVQRKYQQKVMNSNPSSVVIDFVMKMDQQDNSVKNIPIQHFFIDLRYLLLKPKVELCVSRHRPRETRYRVPLKHLRGLSEHNFAMLLMALNQAYGKEIDDQLEVMRCIDYIFSKNLWIIKAQFYIFLLGFLVPFLLQMLQYQTTTYVILYNCSCLVTQMFFFGQEVLQFCRDWESYMRDIWNYPQVLSFVLYLVYFTLRVREPEYDTIGSGDAEIDDERKMVFWVFFNSITIINSAFYCLFYARIFEQLWLLVRLIWQVLKRMFTFFVFFLFWNFMFSWLFRISGSGISNTEIKDYDGLHTHVMQMITVFRNSLGDIQVPEYSFWENLGKADGNSEAISNVMIYYIWFLWFFNILFMLVMLLNLLISIISQAFDEANAELNVIKYEFRCNFIYEATLLKDFFFTLLKWPQDRAASFILLTTTQIEDISNNYQGFVKPIKLFVQQELARLKDDNQRDLESVKAAINDQELLTKQMESKLVWTFKFHLDQLKKDINKEVQKTISKELQKYTAVSSASASAAPSKPEQPLSKTPTITVENEDDDFLMSDDDDKVPF